MYKTYIPPIIIVVAKKKLERFRFLYDEILQPSPNRLILQREVNGSLEETRKVSGIIAPSGNKNSNHELLVSPKERVVRPGVDVYCTQR